VDAKKISIKLAPSKMMENLHVCRPVPEQKRLYKKGCGDATLPPEQQHSTHYAHKTLSWQEPNKLLASPQEARPQGFSLQRWEHGQLHYGMRCERRKQNTKLICDVSDKLK